jgi:hypothetical protein
MWITVLAAASCAARAQADRMNMRPGQIIVASDHDGVQFIPAPKAVPSKCPCCGSRTFVDRGIRRMCAYCRSEQ